MADFKIESKSKVQVDIYGTVYTLNRPPFGLVRKLRNQMMAMTADGNAEESIDLIYALMSEKIGVPSEVLDEMPIDQVEELLSYLSGAKKN